MGSSELWPRDSWDDVAERLSELGLKLKLHFEQAAPEATARDDGAVREALTEVSEAIDRTVAALGAATRDEAVRSDARDVAHALGDALDATFTSLGERFRSRVQKD